MILPVLLMSITLPILLYLFTPSVAEAAAPRQTTPQGAASTTAATTTVASVTPITPTVAATEPLTVTLEDAGAGMSVVLERLYDRTVSTPDGETIATAPPQRAATTCLVTSPADAGDGTLRSCLTNAAAGDVIEFDPVQFPPFNPMSITLSTPLPVIAVDDLLIDGSNAGVVLLGDSLSAGDGLVVDGADGVVIRGLQIKRFPGSGIVLKGGAMNSVIGGDRGVGAAPLGQGNLLSENGKSGVQIEDAASQGNLVIGNYIGVDVSGTQAAGNFVGVSILSAVSNMIGSGVTGQGNVISGNLTNGVLVHGASDNQILGNTIGTDQSGTLPLGNAERGISLYEGASDNTIGGINDGEGNLISDHQRQGILIIFGSNRNTVVGNYIGTDRSGTQAIGNRVGILLRSDENVIGGSQPGARNLISGNIRKEASSVDIGIVIADGATNNQILGNYVGVDASGHLPLPNRNGIFILDAHHNMIGGTTKSAGNVISGNLEGGIVIDGASSTTNQVLGNLIGVDRHGQVRIGNLNGIALLGGSTQNVIGGIQRGARNIISGNETGITMEGANTRNNTVLGSYIGTNISGTQAISNTFIGIFIGYGATQNVIGGNEPGARNLVSGNGLNGIRIDQSTVLTGTLNNQILGNYIGVDVSGSQPLDNSLGILIMASNYNQIGGSQPGEGNLVSGNTIGINPSGPTAHHNRIIGNLVGPDASGTFALTAQGLGIDIDGGAHHNIVGGLLPGERNLISGNLQGISIKFDATQNQVLGNFIGTTLTGTIALPNGVGVFLLFGAAENKIGGSEPGAGNLISGNTSFGIVISSENTRGNQVLGNRLGTNIDGTAQLSNGGAGVIISEGATNNMIGGTSPGAGNLISGNGQSGIVIISEGTANNHLIGNTIGTDITELTAIPNGWGVFIAGGPDTNIIGGETPDMGNLISGNLFDGIILSGPQTLSNQIQNNQIGLAGDGLTPLGNGGAGIVLTDTTKFNTIGISNTIAYNAGAGIFLSTTETSANTITRNAIHDNQRGQIVWAIPMGTPPEPTFTVQYYQAATGVITGTTCAGCTVEFFANPTPTDAGTHYLGQTTTGRDGSFTMDLGGPPPMPHLTATVTKPDRTTFGFYLVQVQQSTLWLPVIAR